MNELMNHIDMRMGRRHAMEEQRDDEPPREARCKFCKSTDVRWRRQGDRWELFSLQPGKEHVCGADQALEGFDDA